MQALQNASIDSVNYTLSLTNELSREDYNEVKIVIDRLGGKWDKKLKTHTFQIDPKPLIEAYLTTGVLPEKNPTAFFPTPKNLVLDMARVSGFEDIQPLDEGYQSKIKILEPSAGVGGIADIIKQIAPYAQIDTVEVLEINQNLLKNKGYNPICSDFMLYNTDYKIKYDYVLMNPPFSLKGSAKAYIEHINHAFNMLDDNGTLVAIVPTGFLTGHTKIEANFRELIMLHGDFYENDKGSFKDSGTMVDTLIISLNKNRDWKENEYQSCVNYYVWLTALTLNNESEFDKKYYEIATSKEFLKHGKDRLEKLLESWYERINSTRLLIPLTHKKLYLEHFYQQALSTREDEGLETVSFTRAVSEISTPQLQANCKLDQEQAVAYANGTLF